MERGAYFLYYICNLFLLFPAQISVDVKISTITSDSSSPFLVWGFGFFFLGFFFAWLVGLFVCFEQVQVRGLIFSLNRCTLHYFSCKWHSPIVIATILDIIMPRSNHLI